MSATPERPGFLLLWIAGVVVTLSVAVGSMSAPSFSSTDQAANHAEGQAALPAAASIEFPGRTPAPGPAGPDLESASAISDAPVEDFALGSQRQNLEIHGTVVDQVDAPCGGAQVLLTTCRSTDVLLRTRSKKDGTFVLTVAGEHCQERLFVRALHQGHSVGREVELDSVRPTEIELRFQATLGVARVKALESTHARAGDRPEGLHSLVAYQQPTAPAGPDLWLAPIDLAAGDEELEGDGRPRLKRIEARLSRSKRHPGLLLLHLYLWLPELGIGEEKLEDVLEQLPEELTSRLRQGAAALGQGGNGSGGDGSAARRAALGQLAVLKQHRPDLVEYLVEIEGWEASRILAKLEDLRRAIARRASKGS